METTILQIKNMVCPRCISTVTRVLQEQGLEVNNVQLGFAQVTGQSDLVRIEAALQPEGFALLQDRDQQLVEKIKNTLIDYLQHFETAYQPVTTSVYLSEKLGIDYSYLSKVFSRLEPVTIEKYFILLKIERVKELLSYGQLTLSEIAHQLQYSSVQHLSNQFKKITGQSVSEYKNSIHPARTPLDAIG
ncbi:AraC family transcriptional regulator [Adhaeribacter arboris]|nr:AraC family transcriptional regulator [Adhaeribacter arboris]